MQLQEEALFTLKMDGKPVINELGDMEKALSELKERQKEVERGTKEWAEHKAEIKALEAQVKAVREEMGTSGMTVKQLETYYKQLNREIRDLTPGTEEYLAKAGKMQEVDGLLKEHKASVRAVNEENEKSPGIWQRVKDSAAGYLAAFSLTAGVERFVQFVSDGVKSALELTDKMGGIAKATNMSTKEVGGLVDQINKIDTRTSQQALLDIAQIGGQLGVANQDLLGFVEGVDRAVVALGDEFTGGAEEVAASLGGLKTLFKETATLAPGEAINRVGSALNALGAAGSATAPVVAEFAARMGQLGDLSPQITQTMGLGAAFQELGLSAEISAGGMSNILLTAAKSTDEFAKHLNMSEAEFKKLINTDPNGFLLKMAESFKGVPADQLAKELSSLGINSQEATKVMSLLKDQTKLVTERQAQANTAFTEGTSLMNEFNTMNSTAAAEYDKSQKAIALLAQEFGMKLLPFVTGAVQGIVGFINILKAAPEWISENRTMLAALGVAILAMNTNLIAATAASLAHSAAKKAELVWTEANTVATWAMNAAMSANPIGAVVAVIALLVAGLVTLWNNSETVRGVIKGLWEGLKTAATVTGDLLSAILGFIRQALEPVTGKISELVSAFTGLVSTALEPVRAAFSYLWGMIESGLSIISSIQASVSAFAVNALGGLYNYIQPVIGAVSALWGSIESGVQAMVKVGGAVAEFFKIDVLVNKGIEAGKQIGKAFSDTYNSEADSGRSKDAAANAAHLDAKKNQHAQTAQAIGKKETDEDAAAIAKKGQQNDTHRSQELDKAKQKAEKERDERIKANSDALDKIKQLHIESIANELDRELAKLQYKYDKDVETMQKSKASEDVKARYIQELNQKLTDDIAKAQDKARKEQSDADKKVLDDLDQLRINSVKNEEQRQILLLQLKRDKEVEALAQSKASQEVKAQWEQALNEQLVRDIDKVQKEQRDKRAADEKAARTERETRDRETANTIATAEFELNKQSLEKQLNNEQITAAEKKRIKLELIRLEREEELRKIEDLYQAKLKQLADEKAESIKKAQEQGQSVADIEDSFRKAEVAANTEKRASEKAAEQAFADQKRDIEKASFEERRANLNSYFDMAKSLLKGDFDQFTDQLNQKLLGEKKNLTERQQANVDMIDRVGELAKLGVEALMKLNEQRLEKELTNIKKEYDTNLAMWKAKYNAGLISKDDYEATVERLTKEYSEREKAEKLKAWKREQNLNIGMAIINAAQAALKSLAMLGWPLGLIGVAAAGVAAAIQISQIKKQQPPSYRSGGVRNAGVPDGPGHGRKYGESGIALIRRDTGQEVGEMEGGEPIMILSRKTYANNRPVIDKLLHSSLHKNGAPIYAEGGFYSDGGTYGDYVPRMFVDGGDLGPGAYDNTPVFDSGTGTSGGSGASDTSGDIVDMSSAEFDNQLREEQIKESQATMNAIKLNTENAYAVLNDILETLRVPVIDTINSAVGGLQESANANAKQLDTQMNSANAFLMLISQKELSISVQNIIDIDNQINVVVNDSGMK